MPPSSKTYGRTVGLDVDENKLTATAKIIKDHSITNVNLVCRSLDVELDEFEVESFDCIVADNVFEHISYYDYIQQNFYRILRADGSLIISLPGEKALNRLFESKNDGHFLRRSKEIHSFLRKISKDFTDVGSLDTLPFFIARIFSKSSEI